MNYFRNAKDNAPTREERLRRLEEESLRQEEAAKLAAAQAKADLINNTACPQRPERPKHIDSPIKPPMSERGGKVLW